ncbi:alpha/beta hydrolase [Bacillus sp. SM2101]|uniref:alpha/beta hydrolase n=1 Tax=Bacillus sp. SM2101 TaxID=2805366 RepID=UPI001BDE3BAF|nr:alpha/beta hydrolase [Bacillus sp. SM2101]
MHVATFTYSATDSEQIYAKKWIPELSEYRRGIVQIAHGMAEHIGRYDKFAQALVNEGYIVYGNDHRGHGQTANNEEDIGYFADRNGFDLVVEDMFYLTNLIKEQHEQLPIFLFGHSMGSFLSRRFIQLHGEEITGVILSGTGGDPGILGKIGARLAKSEMTRKGLRHRSKRLDKLSFGSYNKSFKPTRTDFDWLSRDQQEVDKYVDDALCGGVFTSSFFYDLLTGLEVIHRKDNILKIRKDLPIYLFSGAKDPVGNFSKGVSKVYEAYKAAGIEDVTYKLYKDGRHEMLNETNRDEVYEDIITWLIKHT